MTIRQHAEKAVDYSIRVALISILALPIWFCAWFATGFPPGGDASELNPTSAGISKFLGIAGFVFISPAYACGVLLSSLHVPSGVPSGLIYWLAAVVSVPAFWGTVIYFLFSCTAMSAYRTEMPKPPLERIRQLPDRSSCSR